MIGLLFLEVVARAYMSYVAPALVVSPMNAVPDARLGVRPDPADPGIDARGWRNAAALNSADIVVLGDSIEYGAFVRPNGAWPQRLGRLLHRSVYQIAMGGYGPAHYLLLFDDAAALKPKVIVAAYYLGNDLWDAYSLAYRVGQHAQVGPSPRLQSLLSTDPAIRRDIRTAEAIDPGLTRWRYLECGAAFPDSDHLQQVHNILSAKPPATLTDDAPAQAPVSISPLRLRLRALVNTSIAYRLVRRSSDAFTDRWVAAPNQRVAPPLCFRFQYRGLKTVFGPAARVLGVDRTDPRIVEGERISLLAYQALAERCREAGIRFYVAIISTKELVFRPWAEPLLADAPYLRDLWEAEAAARAHAFAFFSRSHVETIDTVPALRALIRAGVNPFLEDHDEHPAAPGYGALAQAVAERLREDGFAPLP